MDGMNKAKQAKLEGSDSTHNSSIDFPMLGQNINKAADSAKLPQDDSQNNSRCDLPTFNCSECSYNSIWKHAVKRHQKTHFRKDKYAKNDKKVKLACTHCIYTSDNWAEFVNHQTSHISSRNRTLPADLKPKHDDDEKAHRENDDDEQKLIIAYPYKCDECQFESLEKGIFEEHKNEHSMQCPHCNYIFIKKTSLSKHIKQVHEEIDFDSLSSEAAVPSKTHSQKRTKRPYRRGVYACVPVKITNNGLFECEHCCYQTAIRTALVKHQTKHTKT